MNIADYDSYYGSAELAEWRRLGSIDKAKNIIDLCSGLQPVSILDIGCGDGAVIGRLVEGGFGRSWSGVDVSSSAIAMAKRRELQGAEFATYDGSRLPFPDDSFDLVYLSHVVEHLENPRELLKEAARVAAHVFVEVPCEHTARLPVDYTPDPVGHINYYTPKTIRRLMQTSGFTVIAQETRDVSAAVMRHSNPRTGALQGFIRSTALSLAPQLAPSVFCYHTALVCRRENA